MTFDVTKCKYFDLERALAGDKVVTRDGREVTDIHHFKNVNSPDEVYVSVSGLVYSCTKKGMYINHLENRNDLFMAPKTKKFEVWVNVYSWGISCVTYETEDGAKDWIKDNIEHYIKTIKIETEIEL